MSSVETCCFLGQIQVFLCNDRCSIQAQRSISLITNVHNRDKEFEFLASISYMFAPVEKPF